MREKKDANDVPTCWVVSFRSVLTASGISGEKANQDKLCDKRLNV